MKKLLTISAFSLLLLPAVAVYAQANLPEVVTSESDLIQLIERIGNWVFTALIAVAGIFLVIAGFMFVTAGGNPDNVVKARQMLINALIGVAIAVLALGLVNVVQAILGA